MDFLLDNEPTSSTYGDIVWRNGPLRRGETTQQKVEVVSQRLLIRLRTYLAEWFINTEYGVPYWNILGRKTSKSAVDLIFQQKILEEVGVKEITFFNSTLSNRQYTLSFRVKVTSGAETSTITITPTA